ncbi:MAG: hypothetical protein K8R59_18170 [Thermoanaerobaculales bacterium]|nr:hypothetical protein [Thermoanaerobaculales bacterium]
MITLALTLVFFLGFVLLLAGIAVLSGHVLKGSCGGVAGNACSCSGEGETSGSCEIGNGQETLIQISPGR